MKYAKILKNNNTICSDSTCQKYQVLAGSDFNIRFVFNGSETCHVGKRELNIYPDSFLILNKGTQFISKIDAHTPVNSFAIGFDQHFLNDFKNSHTLNDQALLDNKVDNTNYQYNFNETLYPFKGDIRFNVQHLKNYLDGGLNDELLINEYLHHCLLNYHQIFNDEIFKKADNLKFLHKSTRVEILHRLNLAKEYILSNYNKNVSLEDLAAYSCLSVNHLLRTFKQAFKQSPHQYLMQVRLQRARQLFKTTNYAVNEVVSLVGFECASSFIRLFKNRYQVTPLKYKYAG